MSVEFTDNSLHVKATINESTIAWMYESAESLTSQVASNTRVGKGELKNSWTYKVDEKNGNATIGSPLQNAIWEEFGTGEYAVNGDGRKGYWVYVKDSSSGKESSASTGGKQYTYEEAVSVCAYLREQGLDAHITKGKKPNRAMENAFNSLRNPIKARLKSILKGMG